MIRSNIQKKNGGEKEYMDDEKEEDGKEVRWRAKEYMAGKKGKEVRWSDTEGMCG